MGNQQPGNKGNILREKQSLKPGQFLKSHHEGHVFQLSKDGCLTLFAKRPGYQRIWRNLAAIPKKSPRQLIMQSDGNLVLYDTDGQVIWATCTAGKGQGPYFLMIQEDQNVVLYTGSRLPIWSTNTCRNKKK